MAQRPGNAAPHLQILPGVKRLSIFSVLMKSRFQPVIQHVMPELQEPTLGNLAHTHTSKIKSHQKTQHGAKSLRHCPFNSETVHMILQNAISINTAIFIH